jgi:hypothetical protein
MFPSLNLSIQPSAKAQLLIIGHQRIISRARTCHYHFTTTLALYSKKLSWVREETTMDFATPRVFVNARDEPDDTDPS